MPHGFTTHMAFEFPGGTDMSTIHRIFRKDKVSNLKINVASTGVTLRARKGGVPRTVGGQIFVAADIYYPHPLLDIIQEIGWTFGKSAIKTTNITDYDAIIPGINTLTTSTAGDELADLFQKGFDPFSGGKRRRATRRRNKSRKTRKHRRRY